MRGHLHKLVYRLDGNVHTLHELYLELKYIQMPKDFQPLQ